jgi:hypothetical protein
LERVLETWKLVFSPAGRKTPLATRDKTQLEWKSKSEKSQKVDQSQESLLKTLNSRNPAMTSEKLRNSELLS